MKRVFWIFTVCAFSFSPAFSQDDNYYNNDNSIPPASYSANADNNGNYNRPDNQVVNSNDNDQNYQSFHDQLSPYGNWVNYQGYGNVWVPNQVPADFSPYATAGHWVYTDAGWGWVSDYAWGNIPFHYGRWFRDNTYGWMWMPGYQWASAWVTWGNYDNYYCWAPLAPYIGFSTYYRPNPFCWNFVDREHFCDFHLGLYRGFYGRGDFRGIAGRINIIGESRVYGNHTYCAGPRVNEVEHVVGHSIAPVSVNHGISVHNNIQYHQQVNANQYRGQNFADRGNVQVNRFNNTQANHFANNSMQTQARAKQYNRANYNTVHINNSPQYQRPNNQVQRQMPQRDQYSNQNKIAQSYRAPERNYQHSQPVQRQSERAFASVQRSSSHVPSRSGGGSRGR